MRYNKIVYSIIILLSECNFISAQYMIEYLQKTKISIPLEYKGILLIDGKYNETKYIEIDLNKNITSTPTNIYKKTKDTVLRVQSFPNRNVIYSEASIVNKEYILSEYLPLQEWKLYPDIKSILNYNCRKASTYFRGRAYTAWFTTEIPVGAGPWKLSGLPGLILSASSDDGIISWEPIALKKNNTILFSVLQLDKSKPITWKEYCKKYNDFIERFLLKRRAENELGESTTIKIESVEKLDSK